MIYFESKDFNNTKIAQEVWNNYYISHGEGDAGRLYPNEPLVRIVSTLRKGISFDNARYFDDAGLENKNRLDMNGYALEIGFGHPSEMLMMRDKGFTCKGLEVSKEAVERGKARLERLNVGEDQISLDFWENPGELPYKDNEFDMIYALQCIYYNNDFERIVSEIYRCLKPGGHFAFSFFSERHDYIKYIDIIEERELYNIVKWANNHPNPRLVGAPLVQPKPKECLNKLFDKFSEKRIFTEESNFCPTFNSWDYIYGKK